MTSAGSDSYFTSMFNPAGFYYTKFVKRYENVTANDLTVSNDLAIELIAEAEQVNERYVYLKLKNTSYGYMSRTNVYYVRNTGMILGKLTEVVQDLGDEHYNLSLIFAERRTMPKSAIRQSHDKKSKAPYVPYSEQKSNRIVKYRVASRAWRHNRGHGTKNGDIKSDN